MKNKFLLVLLLSIGLIAHGKEVPTYKILGVELGKTTGENLISYFENNKIEYEFDSTENPLKSKWENFGVRSWFSVSHKVYNLYGALDVSELFGEAKNNVFFYIKGNNVKSLVTKIVLDLEPDEKVIDSYLKSLTRRYGEPTDIKYDGGKMSGEIYKWIWCLDSLKITLDTVIIGNLEFEYHSKYKKGIKYNEADNIFDN